MYAYVRMRIALLSNQAAMAQYLSVIFDSHLGIEVPQGTVQKRFQQTPAIQQQAVNDAEAAMAYCRDEVLPELVSTNEDDFLFHTESYP